jgi:hypothetical protein
MSRHANVTAGPELPVTCPFRQLPVARAARRFSRQGREPMRQLDFVICADGAGWRVLANGADCGVLADRETALVSALSWANRSQRRGDLVHVKAVARDGSVRTEWRTGDPFPPLRVLAALMRRSSACFVREWEGWRPDLYFAR